MRFVFCFLFFLRDFVRSQEKAREQTGKIVKISFVGTISADENCRAVETELQLTQRKLHTVWGLKVLSMSGWNFEKQNKPNNQNKLLKVTNVAIGHFKFAQWLQGNCAQLPPPWLQRASRSWCGLAFTDSRGYFHVQLFCVVKISRKKNCFRHSSAGNSCGNLSAREHRTTQAWCGL